MADLTTHKTAKLNNISANISPALEEAFAVLSDKEIRIDQSKEKAATQDWVRQAEPLIQKISEQMIAIEEQRDRLNKLLNDLTQESV